MLKKGLSGAALVAVLAGHAASQVTVDGSLAGDEACYGQLLWVQNQPTSFGDNTPANVPPAGDASTATSGVEIVIPLSAIGNPTGPFRLTGWVASGDGSFLSNQVIGGLPNLGNLGNPPIDFGAIQGQQFITINPTSLATPPVVNGQVDSAYGPRQDDWLQNNFTGFGNATHGNQAGGGGSEIDQVFAAVSGGNLYLMIAGNLEANANIMALYFDVAPGGQTTLASFNPAVANPSNPDIFDVLGPQSDISFESGFGADYAVIVSGRNVAPAGDPEDFQTGMTVVDLGSGSVVFAGNGRYGSDGAANPTLVNGQLPGAQMVIDNSNTQGVSGSPPIQIPSQADSVGSEINGLFGFVDPDTNRLNLLVTGNLQTNFNKLALFFDVQPGGQNTLREDNLDIDFNGLNRMGGPGAGANPTEPGLTFEQDFFADYFLSVGTGNVPVQIFVNATTLRTNGPLVNFSGFPVDYSAFDGGDRADNFPVDFGGPRLDGQDGFTPQLLTNYPPRIVGDALVGLGGTGTPPAPDAGLIQVFIDNSNIGGVTDTDVSDAANVTTGIEISIDLDELGWDGVSEIKVAGGIASGGYDFWSNQVLGGLPSADNLGEARQINFANLSGTQYVVIPVRACDPVACPPDLNNDGVVDADDFFLFLSLFAQGDPRADFNNDGVIDADDFFAFLSAFAAGC